MVAKIKNSIELENRAKETSRRSDIQQKTTGEEIFKEIVKECSNWKDPSYTMHNKWKKWFIKTHKNILEH